METEVEASTVKIRIRIGSHKIRYVIFECVQMMAVDIKLWVSLLTHEGLTLWLKRWGVFLQISREMHRSRPVLVVKVLKF